MRSSGFGILDQIAADINDSMKNLSHPHAPRSPTFPRLARPG
jgi:hypothetical protein